MDNQDGIYERESQDQARIVSQVKRNMIGGKITENKGFIPEAKIDCSDLIEET